LVTECNEAWLSLGDVDYTLKDAEKNNLKFRRSIYFMNDLVAGSVVSKNDIKVIRPGFGLPPVLLDQIVGRKLSVDVHRGMATSWEQFR
jgi:N-acetylneuraminate synthase